MFKNNEGIILHFSVDQKKSSEIKMAYLIFFFDNAYICIPILVIGILKGNEFIMKDDLF